MRRAIATACVLVMMAGGLWSQASSPQTPAAHTHKTDVLKKKRRATLKKKREAVAPARQLPAQTMPPIPATLMNSEPVKPTVTMQGGLLTIDAPNSTLSDVLNGVQKATGAAIEGPTPSERVAVRLGPGEPEQVIAALLRGTPYDYVILGALGRQDVVTRVLLTQASASSSSAPPAPSSGGDQPQPATDGSGASPMIGHRPQITQPVRTVPDDAAAQSSPDSELDQAQQPPPQPPPAQPQQAPSKSPDQLFKELQQLGLGQPGQPKQP